MPIFLVTFSFGLLIGSFLNCLIYRLPRGISFMRGRSFCPFCRHQLAWFDNIPLLSFLFLKGKCRYCATRISLQYPVVEVLTALAYMTILFTLPHSNAPEVFVMIYYWVIASVLLSIFFIDWKHRIIPDELVIIFSITAFLTTVILTGFAGLFIHIATGLSYLLVFLALYFFTQGKGMGFGDIKLSFAIGLLLGFPNIIVSFYLSFLTGAFVSLILVIQGKKKLKSKIPFGPFMVFGTGIAFIWGDALWVLFRRIIGI